MAMWGSNITELVTDTTEAVTEPPFDWEAHQRLLAQRQAAWAARKKQFDFQQSWMEVYEYTASVVVWLSLITNGLSILVFTTKKSKKEQTVNILLIALAIADSFALCQAWDSATFLWFGTKLSGKYDWACKLVPYVTNVARDCSSYIVLGFTIDRFVSVKFPLKKSMIITRNRVLIYLTALVPMFAAAECFFPYYLYIRHMGYGHYICIAGKNLKEQQNYIKLMTFIPNVMGFIIPAGLTAILNVLIVHQLARWSTQRLKMTGKDKDEANNSQVRSLTILLVGISTFSFATTLPKACTALAMHYMEAKTPEERKDHTRALFLTDCIRLLNYCCNFFFYCLSGSQFRDDLVRLFRRITGLKEKRGRRTTGATSAATSSTMASASNISRAIQETKMTSNGADTATASGPI